MSLLKKINPLNLILVLLLVFSLVTLVCHEEDSIDLGESDVTTDLNYPIVDTYQSFYYDNQIQIDSPKKGDTNKEQDLQYTGNNPYYADNGTGTVLFGHH